MNKKVLYSIGLLVVLGVLLVFIKPNINKEKTEEEIKISDKKESLLPDFTLPFSNDPKDVAWNLFQKYLGFNKTRDFEGVKSVVYKIASVCVDPKTRIDCEARMNAAYQYGSALKKQDFVNVWEDNKQIILATDFWTEEDDKVIGRFRSIIFFIKSDMGELKLLSFSPSKGGATSKGEAGKEELDFRIIRYTEDNDNDGKADYTEECLDAKDQKICIKTDPKIRDTDGDGFWDGVQALF